MGNKIIKIYTGKSSSVEEPKGVYRDISIVSERRNINVVENVGGRPTIKQKQQFFAAKDVNVKAVFNSIRNIFTWITGERILNPDFGSKLKLFLYEGITEQNKEQIAAEIRGVCLKYEPRVNIISIVPKTDYRYDEDNSVHLDIVFTIPSLSNEQYTYSYTYDRTR